MPKDAKEEEWEDVEEGEDEPQEEEENTTINNSDVVMKYKKAAQWANESLQVVLQAAQIGASVTALCQLGDATVTEKCSTLFRKAEKGLAFPTCVSVNSCVCHYSPVPAEETSPVTLCVGDVVHIDLGVHVDGYCVVVAHTVQVTATPDTPLQADSKEAQIIAAAHTTLKAALRKFRPGLSLFEVTDVIEKCAEHFKVNVVDGVLSHQMKRYIVDGSRCIPAKKSPEHVVHDYNFEAAQVWSLDVVLTTGKGKLKEKDHRPSVFKVALECNYSTKMDSAREVQKEIDSKFQTFPFAVRNLEHKKARLGLSEMIKHRVVEPYPVLFEREGEVVAHFKCTLLITAKKIEQVTGLPMQKTTAPIGLLSEELNQVLRTPLSLEPKKVKAENKEEKNEA